MIQSNSEYLLTKSFLFTSTEYKIDSANFLKVSSVSPLNTKVDSIPLELINPEPLVENKANRHLSFTAVISLISSFGFYILSEHLSNSFFTSFSAVFFTFSFLFMFLAFKNKTKVTTFFFVNTNTKLFSLIQLGLENLENETINQSQVFLETLSKKINKVNNEKNNAIFPLSENNDGMLNNMLDELYNYGVLDSFLYERIKNNIHEKIYGISENKPLANVITLQTRRDLKHSA